MSNPRDTLRDAPRVFVPRRKPGAKPMVCTACGKQLVATVRAALKQHGWVIWPGGGHCRDCNAAAGRVEARNA